MTSDEEFFDDLSKATHLLRRAFLKRGLKPPTAVVIEDRDAGDRLRASLPQNMIYAQPNMGDKGPEWVFNIGGVDFRYPGAWFAAPGGNRKLV